MADVFISYSKFDRAVAEDLAHDLRSSGLDVWWDFELYAGDDFHDVIRVEIAKAKAVVVVWSELSVSSAWVRGEALEASELNKLISTHVPGFDLRKLPINFRSFHSEAILERERILAAIRQKAEDPHPGPMGELAELHMKASEGDAFAQTTLGVMYERGLDIAKDEREAARLFNLAAEYGDDLARVYLGKMYSDGRGVERDESRAVQLFLRAVDSGDSPQAMRQAMRLLATMYRDGRGVAVNIAEAERLYRLAADQGDQHAQYALGDLHPYGDSPEEALKYFMQAADRGNVDAQRELGRMYHDGRGVTQDLGQAAQLFRLAADQGDECAQVELADMYENGEGVAKDLAEAARLYRAAADKGNPDAQLNTAAMLEYGRGVPKDLKLAMRYYRLAAEQGDAGAMSELARFISRLGD